MGRRGVHLRRPIFFCARGPQVGGLEANATGLPQFLRALTEVLANGLWGGA